MSSGTGSGGSAGAPPSRVPTFFHLGHWRREKLLPAPGVGVGAAGRAVGASPSQRQDHLPLGTGRGCLNSRVCRRVVSRLRLSARATPSATCCWPVRSTSGRLEGARLSRPTPTAAAGRASLARAPASRRRPEPGRVPEPSLRRSASHEGSCSPCSPERGHANPRHGRASERRRSRPAAPRRLPGPVSAVHGVSFYVYTAACVCPARTM